MNRSPFSSFGIFTLVSLLGLSAACSHRPTIRLASKLGNRPLVQRSSKPTRPQPTPTPATTSTPAPTKTLSEALEYARSLIGQSVATLGDKTYRQDCSGTVRAIYDYAGISLGTSTSAVPESDSATIYKFVEQHGVIDKQNASPGDLVFFDNTYDRDRDGQFNDSLTHVGVVDEVLPDGTVLFVHYMGSSIIHSRLNLKYADLQFDPQNKNRLNHMLRRTTRENKGYTAAQLFVGFGHLN